MSMVWRLSFKIPLLILATVRWEGGISHVFVLWTPKSSTITVSSTFLGILCTCRFQVLECLILHYIIHLWFDLETYAFKWSFYSQTLSFEFIYYNNIIYSEWTSKGKKFHYSLWYMSIYKRENSRIMRLCPFLIVTVVVHGGCYHVSSERWAMNGKFWEGRVEKYLELHPIISYNRGILAYLIAYFSIILDVGSANKMQRT